MKLEERALFAADSEVPIVDWSVVVDIHDVPLGPGRVGEKRLVFGCWHEAWIWNRLAEPRLTCTNDSASTLRTGVQTDAARGDSTNYRGIRVAVWPKAMSFELCVLQRNFDVELSAKGDDILWSV
jgi:hypothetical protein